MINEKMNLRAAIKERDSLDSKIRNLSSEMKLFAFCGNDTKMVELLSMEEMESKIKSDFQSLNAMIKRREAINKALLEANAVNKVTVKKFVEFGKESDETEEITLANAINRKNYYSGFLKDLVYNTLDKNLRASVKEYETSIKAIEQKVFNIVNSRFAGVTNVSQEQRTKIAEEEFDKYKLHLIDPLKAGSLLKPIVDHIDEYIQTIDNALSRQTELIEIEISY